MVSGVNTKSGIQLDVNDIVQSSQ